MRHTDIRTCVWMSPTWTALIRDGYQTAIVSDEHVAVMWKGSAARDHLRNVQQIPIGGING